MKGGQEAEYASLEAPVLKYSLNCSVRIGAPY